MEGHFNLIYKDLAELSPVLDPNESFLGTVDFEFLANGR